jgi:hypothetical protein
MENADFAGPYTVDGTPIYIYSGLYIPMVGRDLLHLILDMTEVGGGVIQFAKSPNSL